jgi:hypothetical protein
MPPVPPVPPVLSVAPIAPAARGPTGTDGPPATGAARPGAAACISRGAVRRLGVWCTALALAACGGGGGGNAPAPPGGGTPAVFTATQLLPLAPGHRWVYRSQDSFGQPLDTLVTNVAGEVSVAGQPAWRLSTRSQTDRAEDDDEYFRVDADGIRSVPGPGAEPFEIQLGPVLVLRSSFSPGDTWVALDRDLRNSVDLDGDGRLDSLRARSDVTVQQVATLTTAAGVLTGVAHLRSVTTLTVTLAAGGPAVTVRIDADEWYAPGIGPVRSRIRADDPDFGANIDLAVLSWSVGAQRSDTVPPALTGVLPADGSADLTASPRYTFSEPMDRRAMDEGGFALLDAQGQPVPGSLAWNAEGTAFDFIAVFGLGDGRYSARFGPGATDLAGNALPPATFTFSVDRSGPVLVGSTPLPDSTLVSPDVVIELRFNEPLRNQDPLFTLTQVDTGAVTVLTGQVQGDTVRLQPSAPLLPGASYRVRNLVDLIDAAGNLGLGVDIGFQVAIGRFGLSQTLPGALQLATVQTTDIDGDGRADLLAIGTRSDAATPGTRLLLWRQQAVGGLGGVQTLPVPEGCEPLALDVGDVDGDGRADVVFSAFAVSAQACGVGWLRQGADGSFGFAGWATQAASPQAVRLLTLSGQVRPALVVGDVGLLALFEPQGASGFAQERGLTRPVSEVRELRVGDLDADGRSDLWMLGRLPNGAIGWAALRQGDDGSFAMLVDSQESDCRLFTECALVLGPEDGISRPELVVGFQRVNELTELSFTAQQLRATGAGDWILAATLPLALSPHAMALADIDGDGRPDLVVAHGPQGLVGVTRRRVDGLWETQTLYLAPVTDGAPRSLAVADFDGDGRPDIVLGANLLLQSPPAGVGGPAGGAARPASLGAAVRAAARTAAGR